MKDLLETIVKALVDAPDQVSVKELKGGQSTILELTVAPSDRGKVIGKQGRIIASLRTIIGCAAAKNGQRIIIEIVE